MCVEILLCCLNNNIKDVMPPVGMCIEMIIKKNKLSEKKIDSENKQEKVKNIVFTFSKTFNFSNATNCGGMSLLRNCVTPEMACVLK